ncbi:GGDEF domain-containing protein [Magnetospira sp. QH-2]|uniref:sensor domain-containing diguanylate cyclase n=1 Tax=Magnetospira sp. (strain QH-2) TaxID=1288970 RepID=UPI0003E80DA2|nr:diguanylate cyclase [Magnetospira sp. QH-2]CCQ74990.1 putative Diguanylate kinase [Magnetospira sp. QH-2]
MVLRFVLAFGFGGLLLGLVFQVMISRELDRTENQLFSDSLFLMERLAGYIRHDLREVRSDLRYLANHRDLKNPDGSGLARVAEDFRRFANEKGLYDQIRFLDQTGQEQVRVDHRGNMARIVGAGDLQDKSHRYYFREAINLPANQVYTSPFDLNQEHHLIEVPLNPMIRLAMPVTATDGRAMGALVLNYRGRRILENLRESTEAFPGEALLMNDQGYYMLHPDRRDEWGFMFPAGVDQTMARQSPQVWQQLTEQALISLSDERGLLSLARLSRYVEENDQDEPCRECGWIIGLRVVGTHLDRVATQRRAELAPLYLGLLLLYGIGLLTTHRVMRARQASDNKVANLHREIREERDAFVGGPTVVFKRQNRFGWPVEYVSPNVETVLGYSAQRFLDHDIGYAGIIAPRFLAQVTEETRQLTQGKTNWIEHTPYQVVDGHGRLRWLRDTTTSIRDETGRITHYTGYVNDITDLKRVEQQLREYSQYIHNVIDTIPDATMVINTETYELVYANQAARDIYGSTTDVVGKPLRCHQISHGRDAPCDGEDDPCPIQTILETGETCRTVHRHFDTRGRTLFVELVSTPIFDDDGRVTQIIESHRDVTAQVQERDELAELAITDPLTLAYNRLKFDQELHIHLQKSRSSGKMLGLIMFDLDHFKEINDTFGHDAGDTVLRETAQLVRSNIRDTDILARWGGEEFMVLTPHCNLAVISRISEALRTAIEAQPFSDAGRVTASFGATIMKLTDNSDSLIKRVDDALYEAKHAGRNKVVVREAK